VDLWITPLLAVAGLGVGWLMAPVTERYCGELSVGRRYAVALVTAMTFVALAWRLGLTGALPAYLYLGAVGTVLAFIDIRVKRLPDPLTLSSYLIGPALLAFAAPFVEEGWQRVLYSLVGMGCLWSVYGAQHFLFPDAIGRGDVKLAGVLGLYLGWFGQSTWFTGLLLGFVFGGLVALGLLLTRRASRKTEIPFGPYMMAGALVAILAHPGVTL
jgi:prepilin signal peptidase PulO-like enzyme (type II secretory pathway)